MINSWDTGAENQFLHLEAVAVYLFYHKQIVSVMSSIQPTTLIPKFATDREPFY